MAKFRYKAVAANGEMLQGEVEAASQQTAIQNLQNAGHLPISAQQIDGKRNYFGFFLRLLHRRDKTVSQKDIVIFMGELATLLQAGLPLDNALRTMANLNTSPPVKDMLNTLLERIQAGANLSDAMAEYGSVFTRLQINMVRAGEASGSLYVVINRLAIYLERMSELRSTVITALIYPAILLAMSAMSLLVLMTFVVPQFVPLFEDVGQALPLLTQIVFGVASLFQKTWWLIVCLIAFVAWLADKQLADPVKRKKFDGWCLTLPYVGDLIMKMETARFTRTLGTLVGNGVPLLQSVILIKDVINNRVMTNVIKAVTTSLEQGQRLARPLRESKVFPALAVQLIEVGEESGNLEEMLIKVADIYDKEVQNAVKRMLTLLEPVLILGLGGLIGIIIISILMAMLGLNDIVV